MKSANVGKVSKYLNVECEHKATSHSIKKLSFFNASKSKNVHETLRRTTGKLENKTWSEFAHFSNVSEFIEIVLA